jgi:Uma2 family endonuclease
MSTLPKSFLTPEQYLEIERKAEFRSEYYNGEILAMSGGSRWHDRIAAQLTMLVQLHLRSKRCEVFTSNMRVLTPTGLYTYPDLSVASGEPDFMDPHVDTLMNPTLLVEILSPSTEGYDRGRKAEMYRAIPSLRDLLLIAQDRYHAEVFRRENGGPWSFLEVNGPEASIELASIEYTLRLAELYETVADHLRSTAPATFPPPLGRA